MSKKKENIEKIEPVKTRMLGEKDLAIYKKQLLSRKIFPFVFIIVIIALIASSYLNVLLYAKYRKKETKVCEVCEVCEKKIDNKVNIEGYIFDINNDWEITLDDNKLSFTNKDATMSVNMSINEYSYDKFMEQDVLKKYIEDTQIKENCFFNINQEKEINGIKYYYLEGTKNGFIFTNYLIGKDEKTFNITASFEDEKTFNNNKDKIVDFLVNANKE